jgi:hypothetical protein
MPGAGRWPKQLCRSTPVSHDWSLLRCVSASNLYIAAAGALVNVLYGSIEHRIAGGKEVHLLRVLIHRGATCGADHWIARIGIGRRDAVATIAQYSRYPLRVLFDGLTQAFCYPRLGRPNPKI